MKIEKRNSIWEDLKVFDPWAKENDFISITKWINGEGFDVVIECCNHTNQFSLTYDQLEAINYLTKTLEYKKE